jgi:hypothetical protein
MMELFGASELINRDELARLVTRLALNLVFASLVIRGVYQRLYRNREYVFAYYIINVITFSLALLLSRVPIELGFALGLFAVFSILRYRTEPIRMRNLTYLFVVIGLGMLNALAHEHISLAELLTVNAVIVGMTALLELRSENRAQRTTAALYDNLELLRPGAEEELRRDVSGRTGLDVVRIDVVRIDMLRDAAEIEITYRAAREHRP